MQDKTGRILRIEKNKIIMENSNVKMFISRNENGYRISQISSENQIVSRGNKNLLNLYLEKTKQTKHLDFSTIEILENTEDVGKIVFTSIEEQLLSRLILKLKKNEYFISAEYSIKPSKKLVGLVYTMLSLEDGYIPLSYPWILGNIFIRKGWVFAESMGVPIVFNVPEMYNGFIFGISIPIKVNYRYLFFKYHKLSKGKNVLCAGYGRAGNEWHDSPMRGDELKGDVIYFANKWYSIPLQIWAFKGDYRRFVDLWSKANDFNLSRIPIYREIKDAQKMTVENLKERAPFISGKGYKLRYSRYNSFNGHGYWNHISIYENLNLAYNLYKLFQSTGEEWMRKKALTMVNFAIESQDKTGLIRESYDISKGAYFSLELQPDLFHTGGMFWAAYCLLRIYKELREEKLNCLHIKKAGLRAINYLLTLQRNSGAFPYSNVKVDDVPVIQALFALDLAYKETGSIKYKTSLQRHEEWIFKKVYPTMSWRGWHPEGQAKEPEMQSPRKFFEYCIMRYEDTREQNYLEIAKNIASFYFFELIHKDLEWCTTSTRGFCIEQARWRASDNAYINYITPFLALEKLALYTEDVFYLNLAKYVFQVSMQTQIVDDNLEGYGAWLQAINSPDGHAFPLNTAPDSGDVWVGATIPAVLETFRTVYRYVRIKSQSYGLDYEPDFDIKENEPYVVATTARLIDRSYLKDTLFLKLELDRFKKEEEVIVDTKGYKIKEVTMDGIKVGYTQQEKRWIKILISNPQVRIKFSRIDE